MNEDLENQSNKSDESTSKVDTLAELRWPIVIVSLGLMATVAYVYSLSVAKDVAEEAKDATVGTAKEIRQTVNDIGDTAITIAENFQQAKITETFVESLPEVSGTGEGNLEVATMKNTKTFKRTDKRTILWDSVSLGTTTEIKVPATYRYHIRLSDSWKLEVRDKTALSSLPHCAPPLPWPFTLMNWKNAPTKAGRDSTPIGKWSPCRKPSRRA